MSERKCQGCGGENPSWFVDSDRFNLAFPGEVRDLIWCPGCFVARHEEATGLTCTWQLVPATPFRHIADL